MLDLPLPFKPVMALNFGSKLGMVTRVAYDLKPSSVIETLALADVSLGRELAPVQAPGIVRGVQLKAKATLWTHQLLIPYPVFRYSFSDCV